LYDFYWLFHFFAVPPPQHNLKDLLVFLSTEGCDMPNREDIWLNKLH
jgi:hypothetical protein